MTISGMRVWAAALICIGIMSLKGGAQETSALPYMNPNLPAEARAADLVHRMTLEEKASQLVNQARAIPRLNVPAYDWWSESLHGVAVNGTTEFPEPIGLAATFDTAGHSRDGDGHRHRGTHQARAGRARRAQQHFRGPRFLGAQREHLSRSALGTRPGDVRRRSVSDGADGGGFCDRHAGRRSEILPGDLDAEAFRRAQRTGTDAPLCRRGREQAR